MKKITVNGLIMFLLFTAISIFSKQYATTDSGKRIILNDYGKWAYMKTIQPKVLSFGFRKTNWCMTEQQVKETEESPVVFEGWSDSNDATIINYKEKVFLYECFITYIFKDDKLVQGKYSFLPNNENDNEYFADFDKMSRFNFIPHPRFSFIPHFF